LTGKRLRVEGNKLTEIGLFLYKDDGTFIKVTASELLRNEPSCIEFELPGLAVVGSSYSITIRNQAKVKGGFSKTLREGNSGFTVKVIS